MAYFVWGDREVRASLHIKRIKMSAIIINDLVLWLSSTWKSCHQVKVKSLTILQTNWLGFRFIQRHIHNLTFHIYSLFLCAYAFNLLIFFFFCLNFFSFFFISLFQQTYVHCDRRNFLSIFLSKLVILLPYFDYAVSLI